MGLVFFVLKNIWRFPIMWDIVLALLLLVVGFVFLVKGADWFVDGAAGLAAKLRIPQLLRA